MPANAAGGAALYVVRTRVDYTQVITFGSLNHYAIPHSLLSRDAPSPRYDSVPSSIQILRSSNGQGKILTYIFVHIYIYMNLYMILHIIYYVGIYYVWAFRIAKGGFIKSSSITRQQCGPSRMAYDADELNKRACQPERMLVLVLLLLLLSNRCRN